VYIHERPNWPESRWDSESISRRLVEVRHRQGRLIGRMEGLSFQLLKEAVLNTLTKHRTCASMLLKLLLHQSFVD
jgi:hypothetical protein